MTSRRNKKIIIILLVAVGTYFCYSHSPYKLEFLGHYNKVFAHRVNSVEKLKWTLPFFDGLEVDLVHDEQLNVLDVNHPPAPSQGLNFKEYLSHISEGNFPVLWLDIKNLNEENAEQIHRHLLSLLADKNYPVEKILVESRYPEGLDIFQQTGFKVSYYTPYLLSKKDSVSIKKELASIKKVLEQNPAMGISASYEDYPLFTKEFKTTDKYLWVISPFFKRSIKEIRTPLNDTTVKIILSRFKAPSGNR